MAPGCFRLRSTYFSSIIILLLLHITLALWWHLGFRIVVHRGNVVFSFSTRVTHKLDGLASVFQWYGLSLLFNCIIQRIFHGLPSIPDGTASGSSPIASFKVFSIVLPSISNGTTSGSSPIASFREFSVACLRLQFSNGTTSVSSTMVEPPSFCCFASAESSIWETWHSFVASSDPTITTFYWVVFSALAPVP